MIFDLCLPEVIRFSISPSDLRSRFLPANDKPGDVHHHRFCNRDALVGSESPGEHNEVVGKHGAVHVGFEVIESLPVAA